MTSPVVSRDSKAARPWVRRLAAGALLVVLVAALTAWLGRRRGLAWEAASAFSVGRTHVALRLAQEHLQRYPNDRSVRLLAGRAALYAGQYRLAESYFRQVPPTALDDLRSRIEGLIQLRAWDTAAAVCQQILGREPDDGLAAQRLAVIQYQRGDIDEAVAACQKLRDHATHGVSAKALLGWIYFERADNRNAVLYFEEVVQARPTAGDLPLPMERLLLDLGRALIRLGEPEKAEKYLTGAYRTSTNPEVAWRLGQALQLQRRDDEAAQCWQQALEWQPAFAPALVSLGERELQHQRPETALEFLQKAEKLEPQVNRVQYALSRAYTLLGDTDRAREHRELADKLRKEEEEQTLQAQAMQMAPRSPMARMQRAVEAARHGNWAEADQIAAQLLAEYPHQPQLLELQRQLQSRTVPSGQSP
jgi:tetratricopeptide (TPR) repeat protein